MCYFPLHPGEREREREICELEEFFNDERTKEKAPRKNTLPLLLVP